MTLKNCLTSRLLLVQPHDDETYRLTTDFSVLGYGGVLEELDPLGNVVGVVGYFSKSLGKADHNYTVSDPELQAIVGTLSFFKYILHGRPFELRTDYSALLTLTSAKPPIGRIACQLDFLSDFDFTITHLEGINNSATDALSRNVVNAVNIMEFEINPEDWWDELLKDDYFVPVLHLLDKSSHEQFSSTAKEEEFNHRVQSLRRTPNFVKKFTIQRKTLCV
ncbi:hypothetical protein TBLA_0B01740 [Henningerozyma blattae CBS 6284]|uniref:Reverse transcriptase/retrotransposon-derived protein RNase H-like domain-containing protein n=1 Tax=Henningerozyma blattae (strain ATCC 34711 / CBS 6284 / DSM 70876 / NBRC 10599 / NRRL Y-10934 / UCD 77-7) TaxID=1071380 RepID=I2GY15_HENB6|nr:hypothetical protein TBLA_0B01740 [Tetrapisispora blattae CBS 6284]CCH59017.1 hypothetical protein TBLA_0B01740 [Tetrapisispora blattae CBS 6284]